MKSLRDYGRLKALSKYSVALVRFAEGLKKRIIETVTTTPCPFGQAASDDKA